MSRMAFNFLFKDIQLNLKTISIKTAHEKNY